MPDLFPRTEVGGLSVSRMIIGSNWIFGYSHTSDAADKYILKTHEDGEETYQMLVTFMENGVDTFMGPLWDKETTFRAIRRAEDKTGRKLILIDTPYINVDDNENARREAERSIKTSKELGADFCLIHHGACEQLVNKNKAEITRLPDYLAMIRDAGMIPGLSAHMPEIVQYCDNNEYDVETYIQIYNCMGFLMQVEIEAVNNIIHNAKKPVMTIKPMAAGRCSPFVGLNFSWATVRDCDMVTVGCLNAREAAEDIEISRAALERRKPQLVGRNSPAKTAILEMN